MNDSRLTALGGGLKKTATIDTAEPIAPRALPVQVPPAPVADSPANITVYAPLSLLDAWSAFKKRTGFTNPDIILNAVQYAHNRLPQLLADQVVAAPEDDLFGRETTFKAPTSAPEPRKSKTVQLRNNQLQVIDNLAQQHVSGNRNRLLITCLSAYLEDQDQ